MDKYDEAIEWLVEHADDETGCRYNVIQWAWDLDDEFPIAHCLFQLCTPGGLSSPNPQGKVCGCLTQVRRSENTLDAWTPELTAAIRADERIPGSIEGISKLRDDELRAALQPFAEWQRKLDREIRGVEAASV